MRDVIGDEIGATPAPASPTSPAAASPTLSRQVSRAMLWNAALQPARLAAGFVSGAVVANLLTRDAYGTIAVLSAMASLLGLIDDIGVERGLVKFLPEIEARHGREGVRRVIAIVIWQKLALLAALALLALADLGARPVLGVGDRLWATFLLALQERLPGATWRPASSVTRELRMVKGPDEIAALRRAGQAIDRVHQQVPPLLRPGRSEAEVGRDIADLILAEGHQEVNFVIVASGPNGASPHHETGSRVLQEGDAVVVDIGGTLDGYCSDCTRNYVIGRAPEGFAEAHDALEAAQRAACDAVRPGVTAQEVDAAARDVLADAGFAEWFIHRTGHGIGLEEHEEPYIVAGNDLPLEAGMAFSVEPGIYLPGRFGLRIEDIVVVTEDGCERLNRIDRGVVTA